MFRLLIIVIISVVVINYVSAENAKSDSDWSWLWAPKGKQTKAVTGKDMEQKINAWMVKIGNLIPAEWEDTRTEEEKERHRNATVADIVKPFMRDFVYQKYMVEGQNNAK